MINKYNPGMSKEQLRKEETASQRIGDGIAKDRAGLGLLFYTGIAKDLCRLLHGCADTIMRRRHAHEY
jgi:hypothetical protein